MALNRKKNRVYVSDDDYSRFTYHFVIFNNTKKNLQN